MKLRSPNDNLGVVRGEWGENIAASYLRRAGFEVIDRNSTPVKRDRRLEIDLVVWDPKSDTMVFVEVKQHAKLSPFARRLQSIDAAKKLNLLRACNAWRRVYRWRGAYRFDVIELYGTPEGGKPIIDHIESVQLFANSQKFVKWR